MTTANEILAAELGLDDDIWFEVDLDARVIRIPSNVTNLGVKSDENVKKVKFRLPRIYHDTDLRQFEIGVDYTNANGEPDRYEPTDIAIEDGMITFTWVVGRHAAIYNGSVTFSLCLKRTEGDEVVQELHTTDAHLPILDGTETCELAIVEHTDLLEQWREQLWGAGDSVIENINKTAEDQKVAVAKAGADQISAVEAKGAEVLETIPDDYTETYNTANRALRTRANAIVNSASGELITVNDASDDYLRGLQIFGRTTQFRTTGAQLFNPYAVQNNSFGNATIANHGAKITVTGTYYVSWPIALKAGTQYYINFSVAGITANRGIRFEYSDTSIADPITNSCVFTPTQDTVSVYLYGGQGSKGTVVYNNFIISEGSTALQWEPYSGEQPGPTPEYPLALTSVVSPTIKLTGKNLLDMSALETDNFVNNNGVYTLTRNADANRFSAEAPISVPANTPVTLSLEIIDSNKSAHTIPFFYIGESGADYYGTTGSVFTHTYGEPLVGIKFYLQSTEPVGTYISFRNMQLELGETATEYEPYRPVQTLTLNRTLPGIPVTSGGNYTDANGQQWICDEIDFKRGVYIQRVEKIELTGKETWSVNSQATSEGVQAYHFMKSGAGMVHSRGYCSHFVNGGAWATDITSKTNMFWIANETVAVFKTDGAQSLADFKSMITDTYDNGNPVTLYVVRTKPLETALTDGELYYFSQLHSNYPTTIVSNNHDAHMIVEYNADTEKYINNHIVPTSVYLTDIVTGTKYKLYVVDGKLKMEESEV